MPVREISTKISLDGETEFNKQMEEIDSNLRSLNTELKASTAKFLDAADSEEALAEKSALMNERVDQQRKKLEALRQMLQDVKENHADNTREVDKWRRKVADAEIALSKMERTLAATEDELEDVRRPTNQLAESFEKLRDKVVAAVPALGSVGGTVGLLGKGFGGIAAAGAAGSAAIAGVGLAAAGGAIAIANLAKAAAEEGNPAFAGLAANLELLNGASAEAKAALGQILLPALEDLSGEGGALLNSFAADLNAAAGDTKAISGVISRYVTRGARLLADAVPGMMRQGYEFMAAAGEGALEALPIMLDAAGGIIDTLTGEILNHPDEIEAATEELVASLTTFIGEHGPQLLEAGPVLIAALLQGITAGLGELDVGGSSMVAELVLALLQGLPDMVGAGSELLFAVLAGLLEATPEILLEIPGIILQMLVAFGEAVVDFVTVGDKIVNNIIDGILRNERAFIDRVAPWLGRIIDGIVSSAVAGASKPGGSNRGGVGRHATGLDYVPYDEYRAVLHKGERVLTAAENRRYSEGGSGPSRTVNVTINAPHIGPAEEQHLIDRINREFGGK